MINLQTLFKNHLDTKDISDDNLRKFSEDHEKRLGANNAGGIYTSLLTSTTPLVAAFGAAIDAESGRAAIQKADTLRVDNLIEKFKKTASRREGAVKSAFGEDAPEYVEFFPLGLTEYAQLTKANVHTLMVRMKERSIHYAAELGAAIGTEFTDILDEYEGLRAKQQTSFGDVEVLRTATETARTALEQQLMFNILIIASKNIGHPERLNDFMDQSIIRRPTDSEDGTLSGMVLGGAILNIESEGITSNTQFSLRNTGVTQLRFALSTAADFIPDAIGVKLPPGETLQAPASALGPAGNTFLNVENSSADVAGAWEVTIL